MDGCVGSPTIPNVATCRAVPRYYKLINEIEVQRGEDPKSRPNSQGEEAAHQGAESEPIKTDGVSKDKSTPSAIQMAPIVPSVTHDEPATKVTEPTVSSISQGAPEATTEGGKDEKNVTKTTPNECGRKNSPTSSTSDCSRMRGTPGGNCRGMTSRVVDSTVET